MYKIPLLLCLSFTASMAIAQNAHAGIYTCKGDSVEQGGSTKYKVKRSGTTITIEKGGSTKGKAVLRGSKYAVEVGGSTKATIENGKIYKGGSTWASVSDAQKVYDCGETVAATLWVLEAVNAL